MDRRQALELQAANNLLWCGWGLGLPVEFKGAGFRSRMDGPFVSRAARQGGSLKLVSERIGLEDIKADQERVC